VARLYIFRIPTLKERLDGLVLSNLTGTYFIVRHPPPLLSFFVCLFLICGTQKKRPSLHRALPTITKVRLRTGHRILELEDHLVEARESMRFQATHDLLTSLWNRGVIVELMTHEIMRSRRERSCTAVMMCDIDHFKSVNDQHGHAIGDEVLREVARRLHYSVRSYDMVGVAAARNFWWP
jgi:predicted signal transduction protein with EAL and GGDEF domain